MKISPPFVTIGPPWLGAPQDSSERNLVENSTRPKGTCHRCSPVFMSIAVNLPQGGGLQGAPSDDINTSRSIT